MKTLADLRKSLQELCDSTWALSAFTGALEAGMLEALHEPASVARIAGASGVPEPLVAPLLDVLVSLGMVERRGEDYVATPGLQACVQEPARSVVLGDLRSTLLQNGQLLSGARRKTLAPGWRHEDPELLLAQGAASSGGTKPIVENLVPNLEGLADRFRSPGATALDVGTGVGAIAIDLCRAYPHLRVVGLEPAPVPLSLASQNVAAAGLTDRIELRAQTIEELTDRDAFDFIWLPQMFLPDAILSRALGTTLAALKPGGWLLTATVSAPGDALAASLSRLRNAVWGGGARFPEAMKAQLQEAGFATVLQVPMPPGMLTVPFVARR